MIFSLEGRGFSRQDILKAIVAASGGHSVGLSCVWEDWDLWKLIEMIEVVSDLHGRSED